MITNPAQTNQANVDSAKVDSAKVDSAKIDSAKANPVKANQVNVSLANAAGSIDERKRLARSAARSNRKELPEEERKAKSLVICAHVELSKAWANSSVVLTYFPAGSEVDVSGLIQSSSKNVLVSGKHNVESMKTGNPPKSSLLTDSLGSMTFGAPIVEGETMRFGYVRRDEDGSPQTHVGPYGLREPDGLPVVLEEVGLVLVPLLAFDSLGNRLGSGKGFYDRFLADNPILVERAVIMGVAFSAQKVETLPIEHHDYQLDAIVTELGITTWRSPNDPGSHSGMTGMTRHDPI